MGIIEKLDYLRGRPDSLGVDAVWLSPIYPSPMKDFGYDISNYVDIDPRFGNLQIFDQLITEMHKRGMRLIMDFVTNHTSSEHPWFIESRSSKTSPKRDWYIWGDPKADGSPPNNWISVSGGPAWTLDPATNQYYLHNFLPEQPDLNWRNPEVVEAMKDVIKFWLARGVDGFRVDAMNHVIEDSEFRDDPENVFYNAGTDNPYSMLKHKFSNNQPELKEVMESLTLATEQYPDTFIVTEAYLGQEELINMYKMYPGRGHAPFNFNLIGMPWDRNAFKNFIDAFDQSLGRDDVPTYVIGNHDQSRVVSRVGAEQARLLAMLLLTLRGMPFIYYGEELGLADTVLAARELQDGFVRDSGIHLSRDPERTPMQWNDSAQAGFTTGRAWLPVATTYPIQNVAKENADPKSMLHLYRSLISFRSSSETLLSGTYRSIPTLSRDVFAYIRESNKERLLILLNFSDQTLIEPIIYPKSKILLSTFLDIKKAERLADSITLRAHEGCILRI